MVWIELFDRNKAPSTWGKASLEARNMYHSELEKRWGFLRCCENHWKVDTLTTAHYSQWYLAHKAKVVSIKAAEVGEVSEARAPKWAKTAVEEDDDLRNVHSDFIADPNDFGSLGSETLMDDLRVGDDQPNEPEDEVPKELGNVLLRPKARPLRDPLSVAYFTPSSSLMPSRSQRGRLQSAKYDAIPGASLGSRSHPTHAPHRQFRGQHDDHAASPPPDGTT
jgi:hypothetical protein